MLDGWRLDLLSAAYTSNWWPGERESWGLEESESLVPVDYFNFSFVCKLYCQCLIRADAESTRE